MIYTRGDPNDETLHKQFHSQLTQALKFTVWFLFVSCDCDVFLNLPWHMPDENLEGKLEKRCLCSCDLKGWGTIQVEVILLWRRNVVAWKFTQNLIELTDQKW